MRFLSTMVASTLGTFVALGIIILLGMFFMFALAASTEQTPRVRPGSVLKLELSGAIPELVSDDPLTRAIAGGPAYDLHSFREAMVKAASDPRIDGLWLNLKGVGGSWADLQEMRSALLVFKDSGKPIIASSEDYWVDEGDYYLATTADAIYASAQAPFEFNGFYMAAEFYKSLLDKLEIEAQVIRAGKYKSAVEPYLRTNLSEENREQLAQLVAAQHADFVTAVSKSRDMSKEDVELIMLDESIFTAQDAYDAGLLDGLLFQDQVKDAIKEALESEEDEDLRVVSLNSYVRVPASEAGLETGSDGEIAIVYAVGAIMSGSSRTSPNPLMGGQIVGAETFNEAIRSAAERERVKAIVVRVDSRGGSAAASDAMWREIHLAAEQKPVIISMGSVAASGGYWIASAGDYIVADPLTITGSIGVFSMMLDITGLMEDKIGITFDVVRTDPYADMYSGTRPLTAEEINLMKLSTDETYNNFLELVSESRDLSVGEVDDIAQGRVWSGQDALTIGLVDTLGTLQTAIQVAAAAAEMEEGTYTTRKMPAPKTFIEQMNEALGVRITQRIRSMMLTPTEEAILNQARVMQDLMELHGTVQARMSWIPVSR